MLPALQHPDMPAIVCFYYNACCVTPIKINLCISCCHFFISFFGNGKISLSEMQSILFTVSLNKQSRSLRCSCIMLMQKLNSQSIWKLWISTLVPERHDLISELPLQSFEKIWHIITVMCQEAMGWAESLHRPVTNWSMNWGGDVFVSHHGRLKNQKIKWQRKTCFAGASIFMRP